MAQYLPPLPQGVTVVGCCHLLWWPISLLFLVAQYLPPLPQGVTVWWPQYLPPLPQGVRCRMFISCGGPISPSSSSGCNRCRMLSSPVVAQYLPPLPQGVTVVGCCPLSDVVISCGGPVSPSSSSGCNRCRMLSSPVVAQYLPPLPQGVTVVGCCHLLWWPSILSLRV